MVVPKGDQKKGKGPCFVTAGDKGNDGLVLTDASCGVLYCIQL